MERRAGTIRHGSEAVNAIMIDADADRVLKPGTGAMRVMLYSHDTFGLGHLRRTRALASAITEADPTASALIVTGSPVAGRFAFPPKVDHIRLPGVTKLADGSYASQAVSASALITSSSNSISRSSMVLKCCALANPLT